MLAYQYGCLVVLNKLFWRGWVSNYFKVEEGISASHGCVVLQTKVFYKMCVLFFLMFLFCRDMVFHALTQATLLAYTTHKKW